MAEREDAVQGAWEMKKSKWESRLKMVDKVTEQMELTHRLVNCIHTFQLSQITGFLSPRIPDALAQSNQPYQVYS